MTKLEDDFQRHQKNLTSAQQFEMKMNVAKATLVGRDGMMTKLSFRKNEGKRFDLVVISSKEMQEQSPEVQAKAIVAAMDRHLCETYEVCLDHGSKHGMFVLKHVRKVVRNCANYIHKKGKQG